MRLKGTDFRGLKGVLQLHKRKRENGGKEKKHYKLNRKYFKVFYKCVEVTTRLFEIFHASS